MGSGNLVGVALAISAGGPGAVFWMWVSALLGMASSFAECSLAQLYKERDAHGQFRGGPARYMSRGLGMRWMGIVFSILLLLAYGVIFNTVQANSIAKAMTYAFDLPAIVTGCALALVILLVIVRGLRGVAKLLQWIVPLMALLWVTTSLLIGLWHITARRPFSSPFSAVRSAGRRPPPAQWAIPSAGAHQWLSARYVLERSGMGSTPNAAAAAGFLASASGCAGIVQMIGVLIDTIVICTASAVIIMLAPLDEAEDAVNGIQSIQHAMTSLVGGWGGIRGNRRAALCLQFYRRKLHLC